MSISRKTRGRSSEESEQPSRRKKAPRRSRDTSCLPSSSDTVDDVSKQHDQDGTQQDDLLTSSKPGSAQGLDQLYRKSQSAKISHFESQKMHVDKHEDNEDDDESHTEGSTDSKQRNADIESNASSITTPDPEESCSKASTLNAASGADGNESKDSLFGDGDDIENDVNAPSKSFEPDQKALVLDCEGETSEDPAQTVNMNFHNGEVFEDRSEIPWVVIDNTDTKRDIPEVKIEDSCRDELKRKTISKKKTVKAETAKVETKEPRMLKEISSNLRQRYPIDEISTSKTKDSKQKVTTRSSLGNDSPSKKKSAVKKESKEEESLVYPEGLDKKLKTNITKILKSKNLAEKGDEMVLVLDLFRYFNDYVEDLSEEEWTEQLTELSQELDMEEHDPNVMQASISTLQIQLLRWCAGVSSNDKETELTIEQCIKIFDIMIFEANDRSPADRWSRLRQARAFHKIQNDYKLAKNYKALTKSIKAAMEGGLIKI